MKRFILKIILLLLPIVILAISMEYAIRHIPNDYRYKKNYLDKNSKDIQILIVGGSESYYGVNPVYFSQNTFNAAHVSQTMDLNFKIINKYKNNFNNLKIIIFPISYITLWNKLENAPDSWRIKNYAIYYGLKTKSLTDHSELLNTTLGLNIKRLYKYYWEKKDDIYWSEFGWGTAYSESGNANNLEETGKVTALGHTFDMNSEIKTKIFAENRQILDSLAAFCKQKNVKLILITIPNYYTYREHLSKEQLNRMVETMDDFVAKHNNCYYINWNEDPDFVAEDFHDADHLGEKGAEKLSKKLVSYIDSLSVSKR